MVEVTFAKKIRTFIRGLNNPTSAPVSGNFINRNSIKLGCIKSGQKYPGQRRVSFLFTAGQKYAQVGSGPISI